MWITQRRMWAKAPTTLAALGACLSIVAVAGCGGMGQDDMRSYAIQRAPDPEDEEEEEQATPTEPDPSPTAEPSSAAKPPAVEPAQDEPVQVARLDSPVAAPASAETTPETTKSADASKATTKPQLPTTPEDRARWAAENLERVAMAFETYRETKGLYPPAAIKDVSRAPLLSWRVELLPYLGYNNLYQEFDKTQPWYAPKNKALLKKIPREYMSPERGDEKTNLLVPYGGSTIFQKIRTLHENRIEDGVSNTVLLVEVDEQLAVNWTQPSEYEFDPRRPKKGIGHLRGGQVFVAWGGGTIGSVSMQSSDDGFRAMFTADGGEPFTMTSLNRPIDFSTVVAPSPGAPLVTDSSSGSISSPTNTNSHQPSASPSAVESSALARTYQSAASAALLQGESTNAWQWYYGAVAMGASPPPQFDWYPALRRPSFGLHFGVGVAADSEADLRDVRRGDGDTVARGDLAKATEPYGERLLETLEKHAADVGLGKTLSPASNATRRTRNTTRDFDPAAGITVLLPGSETQLRSEAMQAGCDVLVLLQVEYNARRTSRWIRLKVLDLSTRREIYTSRRLSFTPLQKDRGGPGDEKGLQQVEWEFEDLLEDELSPHAWPVTLNQRIAIKRVASLGESRDPFPPRAIAEILHYRSQRLVDNAEVLNALQSLLGERAGTDLLLGSETKRRRVLREWLPSEDAKELIALAERKRRNDDDDD